MLGELVELRTAFCFYQRKQGHFIYPVDGHDACTQLDMDINMIDFSAVRFAIVRRSDEALRLC